MTDMVCAAGVELLMEYLEGTLAAELATQIETHVAGCPRCTAFVASYRATPGILRQATLLPLPDELAASLHGFLRQRRRS